MPDRILSDQQKAFLSHLATDAKGDIRTAMKMAGYSDNYSIREIMESLTDEIVEVAKTLLAASSTKAVHTMLGAMENGAKPGSAVSVNAAKEILDRAGLIKKEEKNAGALAGATIFILPAKEPVDSPA